MRSRILNYRKKIRLRIYDTKKDEAKELTVLAEQLKQLFIVSKLTLVEESTDLEEFGASYVKVEKVNGVVCKRCWNVYDADEMHDEDLCERCHEALN